MYTDVVGSVISPYNVSRFVLYAKQNKNKEINKGIVYNKGVLFFNLVKIVAGLILSTTFN